MNTKPSDPPFAAKVTVPLMVGDHVKIGFQTGNPDIHPRVWHDDGSPHDAKDEVPTDGIRSEWMWVQVTSIGDVWIRGRLVNTPFYISPIQLVGGDRVRFQQCHIYSVNYDSPLRGMKR